MIVWVVAGCVALNSLGSILKNPTPGVGWIGNVVVPMVLAVGLTQGRSWARYLFVVGCVFLSGAFILMLLMQADAWQSVLVGGMTAMLFMIAGSVVWASKSVEAYFAHRASERAAAAGPISGLRH